MRLRFASVFAVIAALGLMTAGTAQVRRMMAGDVTKSALLLIRDDVQKELKLTPDQLKKVKAAQEALQTKMRSGGNFAELTAKFEADTTKMLTGAQKSRYFQIGLWVVGYPSVARTDVSGKLGLDEAQNKKVKGFVSKFNAEAEALSDKSASGKLTQQEFGQEYGKLRAKLSGDIEKVLSQAQRKKFTELKGKEFKQTTRGTRIG